MINKAITNATVMAAILGAGLALSMNDIAGAATPGTSITYQGALSQNGAVVNGPRDFRFRLYDVAVGGAPLATVQSFGVDVLEGVFSVEIDFGQNPWTANDQYWLEIEAGPADQSQSYEVIGRQKLTATPYSLNTRGISVDEAGTTGVGPTLRLTNQSESTWSIFSGSLGRFGIQDTTGSATRLIIDSQGDVGIGVFSPQAKLETAGQIRVQAGGAEPVDGAGFEISYDGTAGAQLSAFDRSLNQARDLRLNPFGGNIGVGLASSPTARLDVNGVTKLRGYVAIGNIAPTTALDVDGAVTIRGGADIVEGFDSVCDTAFEPGTVLVIDPENPGMLMCAEGTYDKKVAGVVSGAGGVQPGIKLGQSGVLDGDIPVAMTGRVYVKCSAENGSVEPGDLLTTASLAGHAMKATDATRSNGTVIGKAMGSLESGEGLVLVLVNLQ